MINPATLLVVGLVTGIGGAVTFVAFNYAERLSKEGSLTRQTTNDLLPMAPMPPQDGPPLPRSLNIKWPWKK